MGAIKSAKEEPAAAGAEKKRAKPSAQRLAQLKSEMWMAMRAGGQARMERALDAWAAAGLSGDSARRAARKELQGEGLLDHLPGATCKAMLSNGRLEWRDTEKRDWVESSNLLFGAQAHGLGEFQLAIMGTTLDCWPRGYEARRWVGYSRTELFKKVEMVGVAGIKSPEMFAMAAQEAGRVLGGQAARFDARGASPEARLETARAHLRRIGARPGDLAAFDKAVSKERHGAGEAGSKAKAAWGKAILAALEEEEQDVLMAIGGLAEASGVDMLRDDGLVPTEARIGAPRRSALRVALGLGAFGCARELLARGALACAGAESGALLGAANPLRDMARHMGNAKGASMFKQMAMAMVAERVAQGVEPVQARQWADASASDAGARLRHSAASRGHERALLDLQVEFANALSEGGGAAGGSGEKGKAKAQRL